MSIKWHQLNSSLYLVDKNQILQVFQVNTESPGLSLNISLSRTPFIGKKKVSQYLKDKSVMTEGNNKIKPLCLGVFQKYLIFFLHFFI